jgi:hypothetical protein
MATINNKLKGVSSCQTFNPLPKFTIVVREAYDGDIIKTSCWLKNEKPTVVRKTNDAEQKPDNASSNQQAHMELQCTINAHDMHLQK